MARQVRGFGAGTAAYLVGVVVEELILVEEVVDHAAEHHALAQVCTRLKGAQRLDHLRPAAAADSAIDPHVRIVRRKCLLKQLFSMISSTQAKIVSKTPITWQALRRGV